MALFTTTAYPLVALARDEQKAPALARLSTASGRLTSLYSVTKGKEVIRSNFKKERIRIAFNPLHERFDVTDASIAKFHMGRVTWRSNRASRS